MITGVRIISVYYSNGFLLNFENHRRIKKSIQKETIMIAKKERTLKDVRRELSYSLNDVCRLTGLSPIRISEYERGLHKPWPTTAIRLAAAYNLTLEETMRLWRNANEK